VNPPDNAPSLDDRALLDAVGRRNREAFETLFFRCQQSAFALALQITNNPSLAEEAVQEAMLRVWLTASSYRAEGSVRSWIMRIVAGKAIEQLKVRRRSHRLMQTSTDSPSRHDMPAVAEEQHELLGALRKLLTALPDAERQMVALYYGGGLTQEEISEALSIPRRTVAFKIEEALKELRSKLLQGGFAAAVPLLAGDGLRDALWSGSAAPARLHAKVMKGIARASMRKGAVSAGKSPILGVAAVLSIAVVCAGAWYFTTTFPTSSNTTPSKAPTLKPAIDTPAKLAADGWQSVPAEPRQAMHGNLNLDAGDLRGRTRIFKQNFGGDAIWDVTSNAEGTDLVQRNEKLKDQNTCCIGPVESSAREWRLTLDETASSLDGEVGLLVTDSSSATGLFSRHAVSGKLCEVRIVAWPTRNSVRVVSIRTQDTQIFAGAETIETVDGKFNIGFLTNTRLAVRKFRVRKLPEGWKPEDDPQLREISEKTADRKKP
jgi:RNA polymerase sigma-70 factor (ECF subfamily)